MSPELDRWLALLLVAACGLWLLRGAIRSAARFIRATRAPGGCGGCGGGCGDKGEAPASTPRTVKLERFPAR